ncbi:MAG: hypothetical protein K2X06_16970 [Burkholderiales bacterium]|nr:hypothetical protein [Burkholderiales bacterium]
MSLTIPAWAQQYDLGRGIGHKNRNCSSLSIAPGIKPDDVTVVYVKHNSIKVGIKGTEDSLLCVGFYAPHERKLIDRVNFRFADGGIWKFDDIDRRSNLRALSTPVDPNRATAYTPAPAPKPGVDYLPAPASAPAPGPSKPTQFPAPPTGARSAQQLNKCVVDGKVSYSDSPCPNSANVQKSSPKTEVKNVPALPVVQRGLWRLTWTIDGTVTPTEHCGDPLESVSKQMVVTNELRELGCKSRSSSPAPRHFKFVVDCPVDWVNENGSAFTLKGQSVVDVTSPSEQSFSYRIAKLVGHKHQTVKGSRVGNCVE